MSHTIYLALRPGDEHHAPRWKATAPDKRPAWAQRLVKVTGARTSDEARRLVSTWLRAKDMSQGDLLKLAKNDSQTAGLYMQALGAVEEVTGG